MLRYCWLGDGKDVRLFSEFSYGTRVKQTAFKKTKVANKTDMADVVGFSGVTPDWPRSPKQNLRELQQVFTDLISFLFTNFSAL